MDDYIFLEAERLSNKYGTRNPYELLGCIGAVTKFSYMYGTDGLKGYSTIMNRTKYAVINGNLGEYDRKVVAGHEAAHLILHVDNIKYSRINMLRDFDMYNTGKIEREANLFLADFMLEDDSVLECVNDEYMDFYGTARSLYVPYELLAFKLHSMERRGYEVRTPVDLVSRFLAK